MRRVRASALTPPVASPIPLELAAVLSVELAERVTMLEQSAEAHLFIDRTHARLAFNLLHDDLVAGPNPELVTHGLGQYNLALRSYPSSHTDQYNLHSTARRPAPRGHTTDTRPRTSAVKRETQGPA